MYTWAIKSLVIMRQTYSIHINKNKKKTHVARSRRPFVGHSLAFEVLIGKLLATRGVWVKGGHGPTKQLIGVP